MEAERDQKTTDDRLAALADLLRKRREVIADHELRDRDAAAHLQALRQVSEEIMALEAELAPELPPRLAHFLQNCSYDKALHWIESDQQSGT